MQNNSQIIYFFSFPFLFLLNLYPLFLLCAKKREGRKRRAREKKKKKKIDVAKKKIFICHVSFSLIGLV